NSVLEEVSEHINDMPDLIGPDMLLLRMRQCWVPGTEVHRGHTTLGKTGYVGPTEFGRRSSARSGDEFRRGGNGQPGQGSRRAVHHDRLASLEHALQMVFGFGRGTIGGKTVIHHKGRRIRYDVSGNSTGNPYRL